MKSFLDDIVALDPTIKPIYTPELTQEKGVTLLRASDNLNQVLIDNGETRLFMFNRRPLKTSETLGKRIHTPILKDTGTSSGICFKAVFGELDIAYAFSSPNFEDIEEWEVNNILKAGVRGVGSTTLDLSAFGLGDFTYNTSWKDLEDLTVESNNRYHKLITSTVTLRGTFMSLVGEGKLISSIQLQIKDFGDMTGMTDLSTANIVP